MSLIDLQGKKQATLHKWSLVSCPIFFYNEQYLHLRSAKAPSFDLINFFLLYISFYNIFRKFILPYL